MGRVRTASFPSLPASATLLLGGSIDQFSFFFAFYGLILGLAVAELLGGFAGMVRSQALKKIETQTALVAILTFVLIVATWVDTFTMSQGISLGFHDLWPPILLGTFYYLAAAVIFPRDPDQFRHLGSYFAARRQFVIGMLFAAELVDFYANRYWLIDRYYHYPAAFWAWTVPYNIMIKGVFLALFLVRGRRPTIVLLAVQTLLILVPYWQTGGVQRFWLRLLGY